MVVVGAGLKGVPEKVLMSLSLLQQRIFSTGLQVLHRETKGVKLNRTTIIPSDLADRRQITNEVREPEERC
jgi:hypothetical protein